MKLSACKILLPIIFFLSGLLPGCASFPGKTTLDEPRELEVSARLRFGDIPVPLGFSLLVKDSYVLETTNLRAALLKYKGKSRGEYVAEFYKTNMPLYGWRLVNVVEYGRRALNFESEKEDCTVAIVSKGNISEITISLSPRPQKPTRIEKGVK